MKSEYTVGDLVVDMWCNPPVVGLIAGVKPDERHIDAFVYRISSPKFDFYWGESYLINSILENKVFVLRHGG